ncbi:MAG: hypothetical protein Q8O88_03745 [bacterium]|nr:hypothetical protein [bacterium]
MKVECIDASNRPNDIPVSKWVVKGQEYTVIKAAKLTMQGGILGFQLAEIDLSDCVPYLYFATSRFKEKEPAVEKKEEKEKSEVEELVEELIA